jgi:hypothetical protein
MSKARLRAALRAFLAAHRGRLDILPIIQSGGSLIRNLSK